MIRELKASMLPEACRQKKLVILLAIAGWVLPGYGQKTPVPDHDTSYYQSFRDKLTARFYLSRKYNVLTFTPPGDDLIPQMTYRPNTRLVIGIGASYRAFTLNIGIGATPLHSVGERGRTRYFDFQTHYYARKWNFDFLGESYRGYYLSPQGLGSVDSKTYYVREDLSLQLVGIAGYRALNDDRFSYQAGLVQNEWQKRSAGSLLVGGETFYGSLHGDSVLVPSILDTAYYRKGISRVHFFEIGPGIGYAYTLVIASHFFLLASATINLDFRFSREFQAANYADRTDFTPNFIFHAGAGYNTLKWNLSMLWVANRIYVKGNGSGYQYQISPGNYRLIYARHFTLGRKAKKALQPINDIIEPD
jgi:hypothetical protein